jgi:hypothetical protein
MPSIWTTYRVQWTFHIHKLCASVPADPDIVKKWLEARQPAARAPGGKSISEIQEEVFETIATAEEVTPSLLVFQRHEGTLVMRAATVRAHIKDAARVLSAQYIGKIKGERAFSTRVINGVYEDPGMYWIPIRRPDGSPVVSADGTIDKAVHVRGPRGEPLNALKTFEYVSPARMDFTLKVLGKSVTLDDLETLFQYGGYKGYAGERGDGQGRYTYSVSVVE